MSIQSEFRKFNDKIRVDFEVKKELREKKNSLLGKLRNNDDLPSFEELNQGSYAMCTGCLLYTSHFQHKAREPLSCHQL